ncbi:uncharacterized protein LOC127805574 [Diospyros lotus]|uniref:uncharacterized protein LOC127805574 n=1 Tax=Diospyros lotus TaxID=55363 RepID=UPI002259211A|nr:uncharacterized protein LOC127805574 [Diospyros lotus]
MNVRIVLTHEKILYTIETPLPPEPSLEDAVAHEAWKTHKGDMITAQCIILAAMTPEHRCQHKGYTAYEIMARLKDLYEKRTRYERYDVAKKLFRCRMAEGSSVEKHVTEMIGYIDRLSELGVGMDAELTIDFVLQSLPDCYGQFIMNFNMMNMDKTLGELLSMLQEAEPEINKKAKGNVLLVRGPKGRKGKPKSKKAKQKKSSSTAPSGGVQKTKARKGKEDAVCFHCNKSGHWKWNCKEYLAEV